MDNNLETTETFMFKGVAYEGTLKEVMDAHEEAVCEQNCQIDLEQYIEEYCTPVKVASEWVSIYDDNGFFYIIDKGDRYPSPYIAATGGEGDRDKANAEKICNAVNNYDALLEALKNLIVEYEKFKN